jgi:uncharacterized membrane protein YfbV (UPF0208 family)
MIATKAWWAAAGVRAIRTFAQTAVAIIPVTAIITEVNWAAVGSAAILAAILSLLTSLTGLPEVSKD